MRNRGWCYDMESDKIVRDIPSNKATVRVCRQSGFQLHMISSGQELKQQRLIKQTAHSNSSKHHTEMPHKKSTLVPHATWLPSHTAGTPYCSAYKLQHALDCTIKSGTKRYMVNWTGHRASIPSCVLQPFPSHQFLLVSHIVRKRYT
jgi:hypothetical protein